MMKGFKGLDLIDKSAWRTMERDSWLCIGGSDQDHPQEEEIKKKKRKEKKIADWGDN